MALFRRFVDVLKSNVNDLLDRAEDPEKMLPMIIGEMAEQVQKAKVEVARAIADQKKMESQHQQYLKEALEWEDRARLALSGGKEDLAREALLRKKSQTDLASALKIELDHHTQLVNQLKTQLHQLENKLDEARRKKNLLVARSRRAQAFQKIHDTMGSLSDTSSFDTFSRMENKVTDQEAYALALEDLSSDPLEDQFRDLERKQGLSDVDVALEALRAQMKQGGEQ